MFKIALDLALIYLDLPLKLIIENRIQEYTEIYWIGLRI